MLFALGLALIFFGSQSHLWLGLNSDNAEPIIFEFDLPVKSQSHLWLGLNSDLCQMWQFGDNGADYFMSQSHHWLGLISDGRALLIQARAPQLSHNPISG